MTQEPAPIGIGVNQHGASDGHESNPAARARRIQSLLSLALAISLALPLGLLAPGTAHARIDRSDLLSKATVKAMMNGTGRWQSSIFPVRRPLGAKPTRCRSDKPMGSYRQSRGRSYYGKVRGGSDNTDRSVNTLVYRYDTRKAAKMAMQLLKDYATDCPRTVEWVCTQCDGIFTAFRKSVVTRRVGQQSTAWRLREKANGFGKGYVIAARKQRTIVRTSVVNVLFPDQSGIRFPKAPPRSTTVAVTKAALRKAT